jgi:hypothetical protein
MGGASKASQSGLCNSTIGLCEAKQASGRRSFKRQLEVLQKTKRTGPGKPGPMRFQQACCLASSLSAVGLPVFSIMIR